MQLGIYLVNRSHAIRYTKIALSIDIWSVGHMQLGIHVLMLY